MGNEIIHNEVNRSLVLKGKHYFFPEPLAGFCILSAYPLPQRLPTSWTKGSKPLQRSISDDTGQIVGHDVCPLTVHSRESSEEIAIHQNRLQSSPWRMPIDLYYGVFYFEIRVVTFAPSLSGQEAQIMAKENTTNGFYSERF